MQTLKNTLSAHQEKAIKDVADAKAQAEAVTKAAAAEQEQLLQKIEGLKQQALTTQQVETTYDQADFSMLPKDNAPKGDDKNFWKTCGHLFQLMEKWHFSGTFPVTITELESHCLVKDATQALLRKLLGPQLWQGWFGAPEFVLGDGCVLPRQLMMYLYYELQQLKEHYLAIEETKAAADNAYAMLLEASNKKRKVAA